MRKRKEQHVHAGADPVLGPGQVLGTGLLIVVLVVFVADIERGVGEDQVREGLFGLTQDLDAVATEDLISQFSHGDIL